MKTIGCTPLVTVSSLSREVVYYFSHCTSMEGSTVCIHENDRLEVFNETTISKSPDNYLSFTRYAYSYKTAERFEIALKFEK